MKTLTVKRPWGQFDQFTHNEKTTVKIISINRASSLSLQSHTMRKEFWYIISGFPIVTLGEKIISAKPGDQFMIEEEEQHKIESKDGEVKFLEIAYGDFEEDDEVRLEDKYGRA